jgi:hypothetical protein
MRETIGYWPRARRAASVLAAAALLTLGASACGDDGSDATGSGGSTGSQASGGSTGGNGKTYRLASGGQALVDSTGARFPIDPKLITGYADAAQETDGYLDMSGWAAPADLSAPADVVVALVGKKSVVTTTPSIHRPDLVDGYDRPGLEKAGFVFSIPRGKLKCGTPSQGISTYAIAGGAAAELKWLGDVRDQVDAFC